MGHRQLETVAHLLAHEQNVNVERAWAPADFARTMRRLFGAVCPLEQLLRAGLGRDLHHQVPEVTLGYSPDRMGLIHVRESVFVTGREDGERVVEVGATITHVGAQ
jgi:hypothetical protein